MYVCEAACTLHCEIWALVEVAQSPAVAVVRGGGGGRERQLRRESDTAVDDDMAMAAMFASLRACPIPISSLFLNDGPITITHELSH